LRPLKPPQQTLAKTRKSTGERERSKPSPPCKTRPYSGRALTQANNANLETPARRSCVQEHQERQGEKESRRGNLRPLFKSSIVILLPKKRWPLLVRRDKQRTAQLDRALSGGKGSATVGYMQERQWEKISGRRNMSYSKTTLGRICNHRSANPQERDNGPEKGEG